MKVVRANSRQAKGYDMHCSLNVAIAAVQFAAQPLDPIGNLLRISASVADAHARGARLVVLPELVSTGYCEHVDLHLLAEGLDGATVQTFTTLSRRYGVYLAAGFVEYHEGDVYNSLAFTTPRGEVSIYRKRHLIFWEHYYFRCGREPLIVETELGRIGFAICADMMYQQVWAGYRDKIDIAVVSAAWPKATKQTKGRVGWTLSPSDELSGSIPTRIAQELRVPVVFSNQSGPCEVRIPMLGPARPAEFSGRSAIYEHTGTRVSKELDGEGIAMAKVQVPKEYASCATLSG